MGLPTGPAKAAEAWYDLAGPGQLGLIEMILAHLGVPFYD